jgi:hypothetical protein
MKQALVVGGTLGLGSAIVFGAAALASAMFPNGGTVSATWQNRVFVDKGGVFAPAPMPAPNMPVMGLDDATTNGKGIEVGPDQP